MRTKNRDLHFLPFSEFRPDEGLAFLVRTTNEDVFKRIIKPNFTLHKIGAMVADRNGERQDIDPKTLEFYNQGKTFFDDTFMGLSIDGGDTFLLVDRAYNRLQIGFKNTGFGLEFLHVPIEVMIETSRANDEGFAEALVPMSDSGYIFATRRDVVDKNGLNLN